MSAIHPVTNNFDQVFESFPNTAIRWKDVNGTVVVIYPNILLADDEGNTIVAVWKAVGESGLQGDPEGFGETEREAYIDYRRALARYRANLALTHTYNAEFKYYTPAFIG